MKKKIGFVIPSLGAGGGEKSLINLLNVIDYSAYEVDVIVFHKSGLFLDLIPKEVQVVEVAGDYLIFKKGLIASVFGLLVGLKFKLLWYRIAFALNNKFSQNKAVAEQHNWKYVSASIPKFTKKYDAAIGFLEKSSNYLALDKMDATKIIGWIHTNYSNSGMDASFDVSYFQKMNYVVSVSSECIHDLEHNFPYLRSKFKLVHNIVSPKLIRELSLQSVNLSQFDSKIILVTVGRLSHEKGIDIAVEAAKILKDQSVSFQWIVIGDGDERAALTVKIQSYGLENHFFLVGLQQNPYPYIAHATVYVQPSRYEGKSLAIDEAKILGKPIVTTDYPSAKDQIEDGKTGVIAATNSESLALSLQHLIFDVDMQKKIELNLSKEQFGTESEVQIFYQLLND